jgi:hypothetical protein
MKITIVSFPREDTGNIVAVLKAHGPRLNGRSNYKLFESRRLSLRITTAQPRTKPICAKVAPYKGLIQT